MNYADVPGWMTLSVLMAVRAGSRLLVGGVSGADLTGAVALDWTPWLVFPKGKCDFGERRLQLRCHGGSDTVTPDLRQPRHTLMFMISAWGWQAHSDAVMMPPVRLGFESSGKTCFWRFYFILFFSPRSERVKQSQRKVLQTGTNLKWHFAAALMMNNLDNELLAAALHEFLTSNRKMIKCKEDISPN